MKRIVMILMTAMLLLFTGCSEKAGGEAAKTGDIAISSEKLLQEFTGVFNVFNRYNDTIMVSVEEEENLRIYNIDINSGEVRDSEMNNKPDAYISYEPVGDKGFIAVEGEEYRSILKYIGQDGVARTIANDIGFSESINISISPKGNRIAYTALQEGSEDLGLFVYDTASSESYKLKDIKSDEIIDLNYLTVWSSDENNILVQNKYIYDAKSGLLKDEIKSIFSIWSPSGSKIAFILEEDLEGWIPAEYYTNPGKKVLIYDVEKGSCEEIFSLPEDEYVFGGMVWSDNESRIAVSGVKVEDKNSVDWYMKLNYSSLYIIDLKGEKIKKIETNADGSDGTMIELGNLKFSRGGKLLSYTVGNYENNTLYIVNTESLESRSFDAAEYLHWIDNENYAISAGENSLYFCIKNSIVRINEKLQNSVKYTSKTKLDDFYITRNETGIILFEEQEGLYILRYIGK